MNYRIVIAVITCLGLPLLAQAEDVLANKILVEKAKRSLTLYRDETLLKRYHISLGKNPIGPKRRQGDFKTPEGLYIIDEHKSDSEYHLALHISYPNQQDKEYASKQGLDPGDNIMIHGRPDNFEKRRRKKRDWTHGCIAVTNHEIEEIWRLVPDGTKVEIRP